MRISEPRFLLALAGLLAAIGLSVAFIDRPLAAALMGLDPRVNAIAQRITWFGRSTSYLVVFAGLGIGLALIGRLARSRRARILALSWSWAAAYLFLCVAASGLANDLVKLLVGRSRPLVQAQGLRPFTFSYDYQSFPSGHAAVAFGLAFGAMALWPRWRWPLLAYAAVVSASRVVLDVHHLGDVIGSMLVAQVTVRVLTGIFAQRRLVFRLSPDAAPRRRLGPLSRLRCITPA
jgi:membrane-associated phospholipid phosphatase